MTTDYLELAKLNSLDPQAISAIHDQYYTDVYQFARFRVSDEATAEDITGEVFIRLLEAVHKGRGPRTNLHGWLLRTTANIVNDYFRKLYNRPVEDPAEIHENSMDLYIPQRSGVNFRAGGAKTGGTNRNTKINRCTETSDYTTICE